MLKRIVCLALAVFILAGFPYTTRAETGFRFSVFENTICEFQYKYLPQMLSGQLYIPHFAFERVSSFGFQTYWNEKPRLFTIFTGNRILTFDLSAGKAFDNETLYQEKCLRFNIEGSNIFFLPAQFVCDYFDLQLSEYDTDVGTMIRVTKKTNRIKDKLFASTYRERIEDMYNEFSNRNNPPAPSPSVSFRPPGSPTPTFPSPSPPPTPEPEPTVVYLTFNGAPNEYTAAIADCLDSRGVTATFFIPSEGFSEHLELTRRLVSTHTVGILAPSGLGDDLPSRLLSANDTLSAAAFVRTRLVRLEEEPPHPAPNELLSGLGYLVWRDVPLEGDWDDPSSILASLQSALSLTPAIVSLPQTAESLTMLPAILDALPAKNYTLLPLTPSSRNY